MLIQTLSEDRIDDALAYLVSTDDEYANLKADVERTEYTAKRAEALEVLSCTGSAQVRKALADLTPAVIEAWEKHHAAVAAFEQMKNRRITKTMIIEVWRTFTSARKQGVHV